MTTTIHAALLLIEQRIRDAEDAAYRAGLQDAAEILRAADDTLAISSVPDILAACRAAVQAWADPTHPYRSQAQQHLEYLRNAEQGLRTLVPGCEPYVADRRAS